MPIPNEDFERWIKQLEEQKQAAEKAGNEKLAKSAELAQKSWRHAINENNKRAKREDKELKKTVGKWGKGKK